MDVINHSFLAFFDPDTAQALAESADICQFDDQSIIFEEGAPSDAIYLVLDGSVAVKKANSSGKSQIIAHIHADDFFGEFGVLDGQPRSATITAAGNATLARLDRDTIMTHLEHAGLDLTIRIIKRIRESNQRHVEAQLRQERLSLIGNMINGILHDFRNPFTVIRMLTDVIARMHEDTRRHCVNIQDQIDRMTGMAEDVMAFSRGVTTLSLGQFSLQDLLERFEALNMTYFENESVTFSHTVDDIEIEADFEKLLRVLQNLVTNAVQAAARDTPCVIEIKSSLHDQDLTLEVTDNGPGIPESIQHNLFEAFVTHGKANGLGLGMAITHAIITKHGGTISFETAKEQGTTFFITLPLFQPAPADNE